MDRIPLAGLESMSEGERIFAMARILSREEKQRVAPGLGEEESVGAALYQQARERLAGRDGLDTQLRVDLSLGLPDDMLTKVDRGSMAHGLEVRVPYLDHRVVETAARLPSHLKRRGGRSKLALLDVFGATLPRRVQARPKWGFEAPLTSWLRGPLRDLTNQTLAPDRVAAVEWLSPAAVSEVVTAHQRGAADNAWRIWSLMVLVDWSNRTGVV
jgi:asparagine synthase (glutamine-hydrolysing)